MSDLSFESEIPELPGFLAEAVLGNSVFKVLVDLRDLRRFRASVVELGRISATDRRRHCILILDEPRIRDERLWKEWEGVQAVFRSDILDNISLVIRREEAPDQILGHLSDKERKSIDPVAEHVRRHAIRAMRRPSEAFFDILRVILIHWFRKSGPITSKQLVEQTGFSYPTVAAALEKLESSLIRHSDRRIELSSFPRDAWFKLVAQAEKVRSSQGYADRSGRPRSPEVLLDRLRELDRNDIAVAGVSGARHYLPGLDLIGTPRLDLVVHSKRMRGPHDFLRRLDPALKPVERGESPHIVIHTIHRPERFFTESDKGDIWADEVECLLDLHEMRLESQALEFVERLTP